MQRASDELQAALATGDWTTAKGVLTRLTCSQMRRMERTVREEILPTLEGDAFWRAWAWLVAYRPQAFLTGIIALRGMALRGTLNLDAPAAHEAARTLTPEQAGKAVSMAAPHLHTPQQMVQLTHTFAHAGTQRLAHALAKETSTLAYFALLQLLLYTEANHAEALPCARLLMRKRDDLSLNMVSILQANFQLTALHAKPALHIEPYELSYINAAYEHFRYVVEGKKPEV